MVQYRFPVVVLLAFGFKLLCAADWQITGAAGFGMYHPLSIQGSAGTAQAGIGPRYALSVLGGRQFGQHWAVEGGWGFQDGDFEISSGGTKTAFDANAHSFHGDLVWYARKREASWRPYFVGGAGVKLYHGIEEVRPRPLAQFGAFQDGVDARPMVTFGGGLEKGIGAHWALRLDLRDQATPFPNSVIVPAPGNTINGWLNDFVVTFGITLR
ncbi:MAG TPA: hypothetical protein VKU01_07065 [Bryobacteraceae bacterium]|nr:hypothetical protein [Bryobacteraceae bacterium]